MSSFSTILFSLLGGVLPALVWLWFWLKEDKHQPEPKRRVILTFLSGALAVWPAIEIEKYFCQLIDPMVCSSGVMPGLFLIVIWAATEELVKYVFAFFSSFWKNKYNNEPIDPVIYMITAALGFSALENTLFLFNIADVGIISQGLITGSTRFLGATLLHVASSAMIGLAMGLAYYKKTRIKKIFLFTGLIASIVLHTIFNSLIINSGNKLFFIFSGVWVVIVAILALIEKIKMIRS